MKKKLFLIFFCCFLFFLVSDFVLAEVKTCSYVMKMRGSSKEVAFTITLPKTDKGKISIDVSEGHEVTSGPGGPGSAGYVTGEYNAGSSTGSGYGAAAQDPAKDPNRIVEETIVEAYIGDGNMFRYYGIDSSFTKFSSAFVKKYNKKGKCPRLYFCLDQKKDDFYYWYTTLNKKNCSSDKYLSGLVQSSQNGKNSGFDYSNKDINDQLIDKNKKINILDCHTLFSGDDSSEELLKMLKWIINIVRFLIPVLLIGLGTVDFVQAIFSGGEDKMKKAQTKFIKRLIIGVAIFLIPSVLKVILTIANGVWGNISTDYCGLLS